MNDELCVESSEPQPRLGILDFHPIQYHSPLYQELARRGKVNLDVLYLSDRGHRAAIDPEFGVSIAWDVDLLSGYTNTFLGSSHQPASLIDNAIKLTRWIKLHDLVVIHGHSDPWMLFATGICRSFRVPYLLRGDSGPPSQSTGIRRHLRNLVVRNVVSASAGGLAIGILNWEFYRQYGARRVTFAPYSVDDTRFANTPQLGRSELLARLGLDDRKPLVMFCGKLYPGKRPLDIVAAVDLLPCEVNILFVGDGVLKDQLRAALKPRNGTVTGFVNQSDLPDYYHAADVLVLPSENEKWGLVVNEAMAAGTLPVVSDRIGAAPDLVKGIGEIYPCGDIPSLASALNRALRAVREPGLRDRVKQHAARYSLERTAVGFEEATLNTGKRSLQKPRRIK